MNIQQCPKCNSEFSLNTKFCQNCGCSLVQTCPKCNKELPPSANFCDEDGTKLTSSEEENPKCVVCGKEYPKGTKFCTLDSGRVTNRVFVIEKNTNIETQNTEQRLKKAVKIGKIIAFIVICIVFLVIAGLLLIEFGRMVYWFVGIALMLVYWAMFKRNS